VNATVTCPGCGEKLDVTIEFTDFSQEKDLPEDDEYDDTILMRLGYADHVCPNPQRRSPDE
jgi:hypothetical protein